MLVITDSRHEPIITLIHWLIFQKIPELLAQKTCNHSPFILLLHYYYYYYYYSFAILRTVHRCVRGSRYPFKSREVSEDFTFAVAGLHLHS